MKSTLIKKKGINFISISVYISTILFLMSTIILPRVFNMEGEYSRIINFIKIISCIYNFLIFLFFFKIKKKLFFIIFFIGLISILILNISFINYIAYVLAMFAYNNTERNIKVYVKVKLVIVLIVFLFGAMGMNSEHIIRDLGRNTRYTLGFTNPNTAAMMIFDVFIGLVYLYKNNIRVTTLSFLGICVIGYFTDSRTLIGVCIIFMISLFIKPSVMKKYRWIISKIFYICLFISILLISLANTPMNHLLSRRPEMIKQFLEYYTVNLFGYSREKLTISIDNSYLRILIELGLVYFIAHIIIVNNVIKNLFYKNDYLGIKVLICIFLYDIFEQFTIAHGSILLIFIANFIIDINSLRSIRK